ncbi:MAG: cyclic nucleotide-binding domain-containing protein [Polyangia bacterium]|jgi:CRP-like cAMP-binding protein
MKASALRRLLPGYPSTELELLLAATRTRHFPGGTWLCREGQPASSCFLIAIGAVEVVKYLDGEEHVLATLGPGTLLGQTALVDGALRSASLRAASVTTAIEIRRRTFQRLVQQGSPLALRFQEKIAVAGIRQLRAATDQLALVLARAIRPSGKRSAAVDRLALACIQAGTGEWDMPLGPGACPSAKKRLS